MLALLLSLALADGPVVGVTAEPIGRGDDRVATRVEAMIKMFTHEWMACWPEATRGEPLLFLRQTLYLRSRDGTVRKSKVTASTGDPEHDACGVALAARLVLDPPPVYNDRIDLRVSWANPDALKR